MKNSLITLNIIVLLMLCHLISFSKSDCYLKSDLVFLLDHSGSIRDANPTNGSWDNWGLMLDFVVRVVQNSNVSYDGVHIGLLTFGNSAITRFKLSDYTNANDIINAIRNLPAGVGETNLYAGLSLMRTMFQESNGGRPEAPKIAVVLTDGKANVDPEKTIPEAENAFFKDGIKIFVIGITDKIDEDQIRDVSSPPHLENANYWKTPDFTTLNTILASLQEKTCTEDKHVYDACVEKDIVFAFTFPGDVTSFGYLKSFMKKFITDYLKIGQSDARVSVVSYTYYAPTIHFDLQKYENEDQVKTAIDNIPFSAGTSSNPVLALNVAKDKIFNNSREVQKVIILFIGYSLINPGEVINAAKSINNFGIRIIAFDINSLVAVTDLEKIGTKLQDYVRTINYRYIQSKVPQVGNLVCGAQSETTCPRKADIVIILDESTSIVSGSNGNQNWESIKNFAVQIADSFPISTDLTKIGILKFSTSANVNQKIDLNRYLTNSDLKSAILAFDLVGGETNIADALRNGRNMFSQSLGSRPDAPHIMILLTDGQANREAEKTIIEANMTKAANIIIYTIGVTSQIDENQLKNIATAPSDSHYFYVTEYSKLDSIITDLVEQSCKMAFTVSTTTRKTTTTTNPSTTTTTTTSTTTTTKTTTTSTTTTSTTTTTTTRPTTTTSTTTTTTSTTTTTTSTTTTTKTSTTTTTSTKNPIVLPNSNCPKKSDVVFVVHRSTNMNVNFFHDYVLALIKDVASKLDIDNRWNQVAAVSFSDRANVEFYFTNFTTSASLQMAIDKISYGGYGTNLASALNLVRTSLFSAANGARVNDKTVSKAVVALINYPSDDPVVVLEEADRMRNESIGIFTVGSGSILNRFELAALASSTKNMATVDSSRSLPTLSDPIKRFACGDDNNCIINPCLNGGTCREIANQVICDCLPGWTGSFCNETCKNGGDIIFAIDASLGIESNTFFNVTNYIGNIVNAMNINGNLDGPSFSRVGLFTYDGNSVTTYFNFSTYKTKSQIIAALRVPFQSKSSSRIIKALETADLMFQREDRVNIPNYLVVVSDGDYDESNDGLKNLWLKSVSLREKGINILSVGIGSAPYMSPQLTAIASNGRSNAFIVADAQSLKENSTVSFITNRLCNNIDYCSSNLCKNPATCTSSIGNYFCGPCPPMTTGTYCERGCTGEIDLAFLLLSGGVVHRERFQNLTNFAISIVENLDISPQRTRVSLIFWANEAQVAFNLNSYTNKYDVIQAIKLLPYFMAGGNNMSGALRLLRRNVFNQANGDRPNVKNVAILVTNGPSTIDVNLTVPEAIQNRIDGNLLIPVALEANMFNSLELYGIASEPKLSTLVKVEFFRDLPAKVPSILQTVCNDGKVCQFNNCNNQGTCLDDYMTYWCSCNGPYGGRNCERNCNKRLDVIILLDISGSTEEEYLNNIALTKQIIYGLPIDNDNARVAMVAYSDDVSFQMTLDAQIRNKMNLINLVDFHAAAGKTNTPAGFDAIINNILNKKGDRNDVPNYVVVITDGESNVNQGQTIPKANIIKNGGSTVVAVGVGYTPNRDEIRGIATSDDYVFYYPPTKTAVEVANSILDKFCN